MDSKVSQNTVSRPMTRSTRQSSTKVFSVELTPRGPLKRRKRVAENQIPDAAVNGSKDAENDSGDEESPSKKTRLETGGEVGGSGNENEMEVQETNENLEKNEDQEMIHQEDFPHTTHQQKTHLGSCGDRNMALCVLLERCRSIHAEDVDTDQMRTKGGSLGDINLPPCVLLERCRSSHAEGLNTDRMTFSVKPSSKGPAASTKSSTQLRPLENRREVPISQSSREYRKIEANTKSTGSQSVNHYVTPGVAYLTRRVNNIPTQKQTVHPKKREWVKKSVIKGSSGSSSRGFIQYLWGLVLLVLVSTAALLAYKNMLVLHWPAGGGNLPSRSVKPGEFAIQLSILETQFPNQRSELWRRSRIHLERHLKTSQPTEPVSLILTAGRRAERTLHCLAKGLASAFSSALNASVLHIDGASKASQDSDQVKMDIDSQLQGAFSGDKPVAVIHRFEELPPGSTLIFYRYCDHENAAYKRVFLAFTVLLPQEEVEGQQSLKDVEEMVQDYIKDRFVGSIHQSAFNKMDIDKYGGLWSRISHLILPVASENEVEQKGC